MASPALAPISTTPQYNHVINDLAAQITSGNYTDDTVVQLFYQYGRMVRSRHKLSRDQLYDVIQAGFLDYFSRLKSGCINNAYNYMWGHVTYQGCGAVNAIVRERQKRPSYDVIANLLGVSKFKDDPYNLTEFRDFLADKTPIISERLLQDEKRQELRDMINSLTPAIYGQILTLFYLEDKTKDEVMAELGMNETSFRLVKNRAKSKLQEMYKSKQRREELRKVVCSGTTH